MQHIIASKKRIRSLLISFITVSLVTGVWAGFIGINIASGNRLSDFLFWGGLVLGFPTLICWVIVIGWSRKTYADWFQNTQNIFKEYEGKIDEEAIQLKDLESRQVKSLASCRHSNLISTLKELHSLMTRHLSNVTHETNDAALKLINQLRLIHDAMTHLLDTVSLNRKESEEISSGSQSTLENNKQTMGQLQKYIERRLNEIDHDHQMAHELQKQASVMSDLTKLVESVAKQTTIVATNAKIEATRAGAYGKAFGVIADEVTNLSSQIDKSSKQIIQSIDHMGTSIEEKFKAKLDKSTKQEETKLLNGLKDQLVGMDKSYHQLEEFNRDTLNSINKSSKEIKSKVNDSLMAIQFQDITQQQIEVILKSLTMFQDHLVDDTCFNLVSSGNKKYEEFDINQIRKLYVMKKQRDIHNQYHNRKELDQESSENFDTGDITLF